MEPASRVPFIGLTGGMGAGKSEALSALSELGALTLSTDAVVHELLGSDEVREQRTADRGHSGVDSRNERQLTQDEKAQRADFVIRNDGTREELKHSLSRVLEKIET